MSANLLEVISDKAKLIDFLKNKENSVYWLRYSSFYNYFYNNSINKEVFNPEDQILDDNKVLELLYSNNLSGLVKINENLEIDQKELLVYLCLYFMLNISSKELGLKIYSELKKISKEKMSILSKEYAKEINITKDNCFFSEGLIMEIAAAEELKYETNNIKKNRLLLENIKNIVENHYKNVCVILAYCYYDKDLSYFIDSKPYLGNLFKEYINKPLIPSIFNKIKDNEIIIMGNATRHYTAHNPTVNFNSDTITFKDSSKKLKLPRIKFAKKIKYIGEYRYFITFSISLINLLYQIEANVGCTNYLLNFDELLLP